MTYPTIKLIFNRKKEASTSRTATLQIQFSMHGERRWISTGVKLHIGEWHPTKYVVRRVDAEMLNRNIIEQLDYWQSWINELRRKEQPFTFDMLERKRGLKTHGKSQSFIKYCRQKIETRKDIEESTRKSQKKLIGSLTEFGKIQNFSDLTADNIRAYDDWLHDRGYVQSTVHCYHKFLKTCINFALREGLIEKTPYQNISIERGRSEVRKYLTEEQLHAIERLDIIDHSIAKVRDLFVFQCYTGLAYADLARFRFDNLKQRAGKYILQARRQKTGEMYYVVILSPAAAILRRYNGELPLMSNVQYNLRLKVLSQMAGLNIGLTSHMGRHTFAVYCLNNGVSIEQLAKMMGHSDIKTTQLYGKILNRTVESAFDRLERGLQSSIRKNSPVIISDTPCSDT